MHITIEIRYNNCSCSLYNIRTYDAYSSVIQKMWQQSRQTVIDNGNYSDICEWALLC